jgi:hypothetical protein
MSFFTIVTKVIGAAWKIGAAFGVVLGTLNSFGIEFPRFLLWPVWLALLVFLDISFWINIGQIAGNWLAKIKYRFNLPSEDNYDCKVDYILPFEGKWTVFNGGIGQGMSHSWGIVPQRYAYDFIIMDDKGKSFAGDNKSLQSYFCYGKNIIAPADGIVVKVSNKHRDSRVDGQKVYCDTWDIRGNFVTIKHAENEYSISAHLIPGTIPVRKGDKVTQGQIIGKCGNSGNTSEPHLHFQLQSGKSSFTSAGLPISFVNIAAQEKTNYGMADSRAALKQVQEARGDGRVYIGRGLEVENGN